jgi:SAM-dependent methyltransferase
VRGIPRFGEVADIVSAEQEQVKKHFDYEFSALAHGDQDLDPPELLEYFFFSRAGIDPSLYDALPGDPYRTTLPEGSYRPDPQFIRGKIVLDGGCGPGRFTRVAATSGASYVVGLDLGPQVERAKARCSDLRNVDFVQGSVLNPPFKKGTIDYIFTIGVLHHTVDPRGGALALGKLVKDGGAMSVWVYPPSYWGGRLRAIIGRYVHRRVSSMPTERAMEFCQRRLYPLGRLQMRISHHKLLKYLMAPLFLVSVPRHPQRHVMLATIYDYYGPSLISTHSYEEVKSWLQSADFQDFYRVPVPSAWLAKKS